MVKFPLLETNEMFKLQLNEIIQTVNRNDSITEISGNKDNADKSESVKNQMKVEF